MLRGVGRKTTFFMVKYVKNNCKDVESMDKTRRIYLDNIRWITVCIVVIYHVIYMYNGVQPFGVIGPFKEEQLQDAFQYLVYPWMMALLFTVSGMTVRYYLEKHNLKECIRDKTRKLLVPSTIGLFVFQWILGYYNMKISGAFESFESVPGIVRYVVMAISGTGVLWYIQVLWIFSMLLLLVRKFERDRIWKRGEKTPVWLLILLTVCVYGFAQVLNTPIVTVYRFGIYGFCFFTGYFIFSHDEVVECLSKWWAIFLIAAGATGIFYTIYYYGENYAVEPVLLLVFNSCNFGIYEKIWKLGKQSIKMDVKKILGNLCFSLSSISLCSLLSEVFCFRTSGRDCIYSRGNQCICRCIAFIRNHQQDTDYPLVCIGSEKGRKTCLKTTLYPHVKCMAFRRMNWLKRLV